MRYFLFRNRPLCISNFEEFPFGIFAVGEGQDVVVSFVDVLDRGVCQRFPKQLDELGFNLERILFSCRGRLPARPRRPEDLWRRQGLLRQWRDRRLDCLSARRLGRGTFCARDFHGGLQVMFTSCSSFSV